ncbi:hypothetical protein SAMN04487968_103220 [Nocardioides terrae]|uniref:NAD glycohydrolase translocation F5/8 type C domain-containing protein n=1 Tax=Nocardioides terrae TaxID=574651 RepID=A0A1I1G8Q6_9ACTN|nr:hypothetical protein [Nocardioides terrae]SFC05530.1 hypothetical protein SAMN04487968_103220 [Nocardioides terrae]
MKFCMQCGHELGASRTCAGCGTTAPVEPLPAPQLPPAGARYPLFVDEVDSVSVSTSGRVLASPVTEPLLPPPPPPPAPRAEAEPSMLWDDPDATQVRLPAVPVLPPRRGGLATVWLTLGALVLGLLVLGGWLLTHGSHSKPEAGHGRSTAGAGSATPSASGDDVASTATAKAPVTRAPGVDTQGRPTTYDASNMLDGKPSTAWEMPGDGTGKALTFTLAAPTHLTSVGLVNGYAKTAREGAATVDWYAGNRRVLKVEWVFDDGSSISQDLHQTKELQTTKVDVTTKTVTLRLLDVSEAGKGPARRDMTPISEVSLTGQAS